MKEASRKIGNPMRPQGRVFGKFLVGLAFWLAAVSAAIADPVSFSATVDKNEATVGEQIILSLRLTGVQNAPASQLTLNGFQTQYLGPLTQFSVINGQTSSSVTHRYLLTPQRTGSFTIGPVSIIVEGQTLTAPAITIAVSAQRSPALSAGAPLSQETTQNSQGLQDRIFVALDTNKKTAFVNEKLALTVKLCANRLPIRDVRFPLMNAQGFSLGDFGQPRQYQDIINGLTYDVLDFQTDLFGTRPGDFTIGPAQINCTLLVSRRQGDEMQGLLNANFFNNFFGVEARLLDLKSEPLAIKILPLPEEGKPKDFFGAIGVFTLDVSVTPQEVRLSDPFTAKMTIRGQGNFATVTKPVFIREDGFKFYEPQIKEEGGAKIFEQVISPQVKSLTEIPGVRFSFFDPATQQYQTLTAGPWPLKVLDQDPSSFPTPASVVNQAPPEKKEKLGSDIYYIKEFPGRIGHKNSYLFLNPGFWVACALPLPLLGGFVVWCDEKKKQERDPRYARRLRAPRKAKRGLREAHRLLESGKNEEFYTLVFKIIREYFGDRFHMPSAAITLQTVQDHLKTKAVPVPIQEMIQGVFNDCDAARYAPTTFQREQMQKTLRDTEAIIDHFEKSRI